MSKKNYRLLTTAIVTALDPSNPSRVGEVWNPVEVMDVQEADALSQVGIAEVTSDKITCDTYHVRRAAKADARPPVSGEVEVPKRQDDGTYRNKNGVQVNADGSELGDDEAATEAYKTFLSRPADDVITDIGNLSNEQLTALPILRKLEKAGKARKSVLAALEA